MKELEAIPLDAERRRVAARIEGLSEQPRPPGCQKLSGSLDRYRVRQGRYRVVYSIDDRARLVIVFRIGDRKCVYRSGRQLATRRARDRAKTAPGFEHPLSGGSGPGIVASAAHAALRSDGRGTPPS